MCFCCVLIWKLFGRKLSRLCLGVWMSFLRRWRLSLRMWVCLWLIVFFLILCFFCLLWLLISIRCEVIFEYIIWVEWDVVWGWLWLILLRICFKFMVIWMLLLLVLKILFRIGILVIEDLCYFLIVFFVLGVLLFCYLINVKMDFGWSISLIMWCEFIKVLMISVIVVCIKSKMSKVIWVWFFWKILWL